MSDPISRREDEQRSKLVELREQLDEIDAKILSIADKEAVLTPDEEAVWEELLVQRSVVEPEYRKLEGRARTAEDIKSKTYHTVAGTPSPRKSSSELFQKDIRAWDYRQTREAALRVLDDKEATFHLRSNQMDALNRAMRSDNDYATRLVVTENEDYRSAFLKMVTRPNGAAFLTDPERAALGRYEAYESSRAQSLTTTAGGFAVPVLIDPSFILTDQESGNPYLRICRTVDVNTNQWKGVSGAGVSWSFDAEGTEVSDDSVTLAQPSVGIYMARGFIPFSIEVSQDWPGFQDEMARLLASGYDELLVSAFSTGAGTAGPRGIITALDANTNDEVAVTTVAAFGQEDIYKVWAALPEKYRRNASWMMSVGINNRIRQMGTSTQFHAYTVNMTAGALGYLMDRPVYTNTYFPDFVSTTGQANILVVGDWDNYVIARRSGMSVELLPLVTSTGAQRPTGQRGWFAYARIGSNSVNDLGFRLLHNT